MKNIALSTLALCSAFALTACGGSDKSGGIGESTPKVNTHSTIDQSSPSSSATKPIDTAKPNVQIEKFGEVIVDDFSGGPDAVFDQLLPLKVTDINKLTIDGKVYDLNSKDDTSFLNNNSGPVLSYSRIGNVGDGQTKRFYRFYQGELTPVAHMPTKGTAVYKGNVVDKTLSGDAIASLNVDFDQKKLLGKFSDKQTSYSLSADIKENKFSGITDGYEMKGAFFGPNADEIMGLYRTLDAEDTTEGLFGAKKQ